MPRVAIKTGHGPATVEGFPASAERSCVGALHLHPGHFRDVTADELEHIRKGKHHVHVLEDAPATVVSFTLTVSSSSDEGEEAPAEGDQASDETAPKRKRAKKPQPE